MANLEDRVSFYIGASNVPDADDIDQFLNDGAVKHLRYLTPEQREKFASEKSDDGSGVDVRDTIVVSVHKSGYPSTKFPVTQKQQLQDSDSIYEATDFSPAHVVDQGKVHVYPDGGTVLGIDYPDLDADTDESIDVLPDDLETATVIYASLQGLNQNLSSKVDGVSDTLDMPSVPSLASYPDTPTISISASSVVSTTIDDLPAPPTLSAPTKPGDLSGDYDEFDSRHDDDDVEQAQAIIQKIQTELEEYASDVSVEVQEYQGEVRDHLAEIDTIVQQAQTTLQEELKNADLEQQKNIQQAQVDLQKYNSEVQQVSSENSEKLQQFQFETQQEANRFQSKLQGEVQNIDSTIKQIETLKIEYQEIIAPYMQREAQ